MNRDCCTGAGFKYSATKKNDADVDFMNTIKNICETPKQGCEAQGGDNRDNMNRYDSYSSNPEEVCCDDDEEEECSEECITMVPGPPRNPKEEAKLRKQKEKEAKKKRKQLVKECKKKAKEIAKEYKKKEKERQKREKDRRKKIKDYEKKKLKQEKKCKKDRDRCEKDKEKARKQKEKEKLKRLKEKMKIKCESLKYAHQNEDDCEDTDMNDCCERASANINNTNKNVKQSMRGENV